MQPGKSPQQQLPLTAKGSRGGARPVEVGQNLEHELKRALGALPGVTLWRNPKVKAFTVEGKPILTGIAGKGAPDFLAEIRTRSGVVACVWLETKAGEGELNPDQRDWHAAAKREGRHVRVIRTPDDALEVVREFQAGARA
ncbi:MAG: hypothetical protein Q8S73_43055 [Deltaproteobacteria bacterium]|nr:hypothetical protein [Myxococcales bacterium]MDP3220942.1 hypothetical protein [Deltaproteobacteria bacterium]